VALSIELDHVHDEFVLILTLEGGGFQCPYDC